MWRWLKEAPSRIEVTLFALMIVIWSTYGAVLYWVRPVGATLFWVQP
ncbi:MULTISPECIES: hypothetical protein [unclassified Yoonia]|nr:MULTISPECIES: hypothetical protein [unclassified Yoonia]